MWRGKITEKKMRVDDRRWKEMVSNKRKGEKDEEIRSKKGGEEDRVKKNGGGQAKR